MTRETDSESCGTGGPLRRLAGLCLAAALLAAPIGEVSLAADKPAKQVFGAMSSAAALKPASHGFYSRGCLAGAIAMPYDGPTWQVMRISRNRRWGHPDLIALIEKLSIKAHKDGWNGLLIGDISQPRGGPMLTGHASHQIGLDADLWFTPMPNRRLSFKEREETSAVSMLKKGSNYVDDRRWNPTYERLLRDAASFREVERILVHPGIKKKLCDTVTGDRSWLRKVRPYYGHHYHFHLRIGCPPGSSDCRRQDPTPAGDGCDASLKWWFDVALAPKKPSKKDKKAPAKKPKIITVRDLPSTCQAVVGADNKDLQAAVFNAPSLSGFAAPDLDLPKKFDPLAALSSRPIEASAKVKTASTIGDLVQDSGFADLTGPVPIPTPRPTR
ncbi:MAG: penicillin-insensitive murein endopeptidase [Nitratireductor sp.]|nr:penicillin-insensitive murein endopeptidase [Nitratireductor sp.]